LTRTRRTPVFLVAAILCGVHPAAADDVPAPKPPLTKEQEREKFHPKAAGMDAATRLAGFEKRRQMERDSPLSALRFRSVGPEVQGGRVVDIEAPAAHPESLLVAFASGGLWRTDNRGTSWTPVFDQESSVTIGDFAIADGDGQVLYVGTGENNSSRTSYAGTGVFKTTDGGATWRNIGLADSHHIGRVVVDPRDPRTVYVAATGHLYTESAERGVYKTTDGGETWNRVLFADERTGAIDLVQDPSAPDILYAATWERARTSANFLESGPGSGIWKSTDAGGSWARLGGGLPTGATVGRIGLALAASRPATLYAVVDNQARRPETEPFDEETPPGELTPRRLLHLSGAAFARLDDAVVARFLKHYEFPTKMKAARLKADVKAGRITVADLVAYLEEANPDLFRSPVIGPQVYRTDDGGATWRRAHEGRIEKVFYTYGYYFARIAVDPTDPERVFFGGVPLLGSTDGGRTWKGLDARGVHGDHHVLFIDPRAPQRVALGNDGGLNLSFDRGATWTKVNNLPVGQFTTLALDNSRPYNIVGGLQDNGVMRGPSVYKAGKTDPQAWKEIYGGDGSAVAVDPKEANVVYAASQFGAASRLDLKTGKKERIRPRAELSAKNKEKPLRYNWVTPFILSPHSREILYFGANRLYRSFDRGETWNAISPELTSNPEQGDVPFGTITSVSESLKTFGTVYAGTDEGRVWGTRDGGNTWTDLSAGLAKDRWVTRVLASAHDEGTVYVAQSGYRNDDFAAYLFRSTDFGKTWQSLAAGLPAEPVNTVREDPKARHLLYAGTDSGAFVSLDAGKSWIVLTGGLPRVAVHELLVHPREGDLVLATHGRSVFVAEAAPLRKLTEAAMAKPLQALPVKTVEGDPGRGYGEHPYLTWSRDDPVARIAYWSNGGAPVRITIRDENGSAWQELAGPQARGLNVVEYDLAADPGKADAAEAVAREKARAREAREKPDHPAAAAAAAASDDEEGDEGEDEGEKTNEKALVTAPAKPLTDPELARVLADPLRATRKRYLPPGKYTVEIASGGLVEKTSLTIKLPKKDRDDEE
jgi:photosystem II stability/assembly factor-like uncharacterized protein